MTDDPTPVRTIPSTAPDAERPDTRRTEYLAGAPSRRLSRAMIDGTRGVRAMGTAALPRWPAEDPAFYRLRANIAQVTRYYARTVEAVTGMIAGDPPTLDAAADARIVEDWEDIDRRGTHGDVFSRNLVHEMIIGGFAAVLVDAPPIPSTLTLTLANEQRMGLRPYWVLLAAESIISWQTEAPNWADLMAAFEAGTLTDADVGRMARQEIVRQVVIQEPISSPVGAFGVAARDRYRVLRLTAQGVRFVVWEHVPANADGTGEHFRLVDEGAMLGARRQELDRIPLALAYPKRPAAPFVSDPPFEAIAELNLDHHGLTTDRRYLIKHTHSPTLYLFGVDEDRDEAGATKPIKVGPNSVIRARNPDAKIGYASASADALAASKEERDEVVRQIAALGMSFLAKDRQSGGTETAKGRSMDLAAENSTHAAMARGVQDALEQALVFHARHYDCQPPSVEMHTAYAAPTVDPQMAAVLWQAVIAGRLDVESWLTFLTTGRLPEHTDVAMVTARLLAELEAGAETDALRAQDLMGVAPVA